MKRSNCKNGLSVWEDESQRRSFDFRCFGAILFCQFFDVVDVCLCEILPCFCLVVNLERSSFWVRCLWFFCGCEITASLSLAKTVNDDSCLGFAPECLPSLLVFCFSEQFGDEKATEPIFFVVFSLLVSVMWEAFRLHWIIDLVWPDVVLIDDFWGVKINCASLTCFGFRVSNARESRNMQMRCERFLALLCHCLAWTLLILFLRWVAACVWRNVPVYSCSLIWSGPTRFR